MSDMTTKPDGAKYGIKSGERMIWDIELLARLDAFHSKKAEHHRFNIKGLRIQGPWYSNQDFDTLSAALAYLRKAERFE